MSRAQPASDYVSRSNTGMKNRIINGGMDISQRGTSFTNVTADLTFCTDRWRIGNSTSAIMTLEQSSDAPPNSEFRKSFRLTITTAHASLGEEQRLSVLQSIEGYNISDLVGRTFTVSFWVRSSKTGIHSISLNNLGFDRSYVVEYTVSTSNSWEYKTFTVIGGLPNNGGTWNYTNGAGLYLLFRLANGSYLRTTTLNTWLNGDFRSTPNQVNCADTIGNIFAITGVQLEVGAIATPFEHRLYGAELALCQRYYQQYGGNSTNERMGISFNFSTTETRLAIPLGINMRATPTLIGVSNFSDWSVETAGGVVGITNIVVDQSNSKFFCLNCTTGTAITAGQASQVMANVITARLGITAEL